MVFIDFFNPREDVLGQDVPATAIGYCASYHFVIDQDTIHYPRDNYNCLLLGDRINNLFASVYYWLNQDSLIPDRTWLVESLIAHEFGHSIGMGHVNPQDTTIMRPSFFILLNGRLDIYKQQYANQNYDEALIRRPYDVSIDQWSTRP